LLENKDKCVQRVDSMMDTAHTL